MSDFDAGKKAVCNGLAQIIAEREAEGEKMRGAYNKAVATFKGEASETQPIHRRYSELNSFFDQTDGIRAAFNSLCK